MSTHRKIWLSAAVLILVMAVSLLIINVTPITQHTFAKWTLLVFSFGITLFLAHRILSLTRSIHEAKYDAAITEYTLKIDQQKEVLNQQKEALTLQKDSLNQQKEIIASLKQQYSDTLVRMQETFTPLQDVAPEPQQTADPNPSYFHSLDQEIQAPLNAIISLSKLTLNERNLTSDAAAALHQIYYNGTTMLNDMNNLRSLEESETPTLHPVTYDTPSLIKDIISLHIPAIQETDITLQLYVDQQLPSLLQGDSMWIKQICHTLLTTILKFIHSGSILLQISWKANTESLQFQFTIPEPSEDNDIIPSTHPSLILVSRLTAMMYGTVEVEQEPDNRTTYCITLGQSVSSQEPIGKEMAESLIGLSKVRSIDDTCARIPINLSHAHMLIADPNSTNRNVLKRILAPYKLNIDWTASYHQTLHQLAKNQPLYDVLLLHHTPPHLDAFALAHDIHNPLHSHHTQSPPILLLSEPTHIPEESASSSADQPIQEFLCQPIDSMQLDITLRNLLKAPYPKSVTFIKSRIRPTPKYPW